jgi:pentatricopeptide repeat domain-containing protein 1
MNVCKNVEGFQVSSSVWLRNTILHQRHCYHRYSLDVDSALSLSNRHWSDDPNHQRRRDMIVTTVPPAKPPTLYDNNSDDPSNANNGKNIYPITPRRIEPNRIQRTPEKYQFQQPDIERQISLAGRQGRTDDALRLFYSITQPPPPKDQHLQPPKILLPTIRQLNAVIDACARARPVRLTTALEIVNTYTTATIPPNTNNTKQNVVPSSPSTSAVRKLEPNVYTYGSLMNAISRSGDIDLALQVLQYMQSPHSTVRPNVVVYQSAISAAANAARPDISLQLLEDAQKNHVPITVIGYNAAITAAARANQYTLAMDLLRQMQSDPTLPQPDIVTYGTVMAACEYGNQWQLVLQFAEEIENSTATIKNATDAATVGDHSRPNISLDGMAITSALKACQQLGYASLALHYLDRMKSLTNNNITQSNSYTVTSGRERIGSKQPLLGPDAVAYRLAISACARGGAWEDGIRLLDEYCATVNDQDVVAYTAAITGCEYAGRWVEAVQLLVRMRQVANVQPNVVTFAAVIGACATVCAQMMTDPVAATNKNNNNNHLNGAMPLPQKKALQILNVMKKNPNVVDPNIQVYNAAIRTCAEAMDIKGAFQVYQMIKDDVHQIEPNVITYGTLMLACERVGSMKGMDQVFAQMRHDQIRPNEIIYGTAISCCRKADEKERAYALLNKMIQDGYHPNVATINTVLIAQTENFKSNSSSGMKSSNTDLDRAIQIFKNFFLPTTTTAAATPAPIQPSRQTYSIMIRAFSSNQRPKDAEALLRRMRTVDGLIPDVDLYTITVSAYERIGQPLNALRLMESMREDGYDFYDVEVLNTLFKRLVKLVSAVGQTFGKATGKSSDNSTTII